MNVDLNAHISLTSNGDIEKICRKFFIRQKIPINHLNYIHKYPDGSVFYLCSNHAWMTHYITNQYMKIGAFETNSALSESRYVLWDSLDSDDVILKDSRELIHVGHGLTVVEKSRNGIGYFNFGISYADSRQANLYINNLDILNKFIIYFYEQTKSLFKEGSKQRIILNPTSAHPAGLLIMPSAKNSRIRLTEREKECIEWYLRGKNSGEIAIILGISRRTVETHIEHLKLKFGCRNLCQLGYHVASNYGF